MIVLLFDSPRLWREMVARPPALVATTSDRHAIAWMVTASPPAADGHALDKDLNGEPGG